MEFVAVELSFCIVLFSRRGMPVEYGSENIQVITDALHASITLNIFINLFQILGENVFH
mgnify:CR=1 FL=1